MEYAEWLENVKKAHLELKTPLTTDVDPAKLIFMDTELLFKEFQLHVDLVKHYLDLVIKFNVFYYAVTGALLSYYFTNFKTETLVRWSLMLPIFMSLLFGGLFLGASRALPRVDTELGHISRLLNFVKPEVSILRYALVASGILFLGVGAVLFGAFVIRT
jgi:hypothetical protein